MAQPNSNIKIWFFCFLLLSMVAFNHGKLDDQENIHNKMYQLTGRKLFNENNDENLCQEKESTPWLWIPKLLRKTLGVGERRREREDRILHEM